VSKIKMIKIGGFIATMAAGAAMIGAAATGTGAYFTDSKTGGLVASTGHLTLNTTDANLRFDDLVPGEDKTKTIDYNVDATGKSDVWLVFNPTDVGYLAWTGASDNPLFPAGGLGRYGHFVVANGGSTLFQSRNLKLDPAGPGTAASCSVDPLTGRGGSDVGSTSPTDTPPYCGVPTAIKIASNLSSGEGGVLNMTFGVSGRWTAQHSPVASVPFKVVATQAGVRPDAANF
jgi:hypothetical protein